LTIIIVVDYHTVRGALKLLARLDELDQKIIPPEKRARSQNAAAPAPEGPYSFGLGAVKLAASALGGWSATRRIRRRRALFP
jgi:hypothetical protein